MQSSDTPTGARVNSLCHIFSQKWNARSKKQVLLFNFGEDLSYLVILLRDFIKIYDDYVNDPIKGDFQKTLLLFHIGRKSFYLL